MPLVSKANIGPILVTLFDHLKQNVAAADIHGE
jgi:hypothetical protein